MGIELSDVARNAGRDQGDGGEAVGDAVRPGSRVDLRQDRANAISTSGGVMMTMRQSTFLARSPAGGAHKPGLRWLTLPLAAVVLATGAAHAADEAHSPSAGPSLVPSLAARIAAMPKYLRRARAPGLLPSIEAAESAQRAGAAKGVKVSVLVTDSVGEPVVLLSGDGAGVRSQLIARTKAAIAIKYRMPSSEVALKAQTDPRLNAEAAADPNIGMLRGGGLPLIRGGEMIGAVAVSGGSLGPTH